MIDLARIRACVSSALLAGLFAPARTPLAAAIRPQVGGDVRHSGANLLERTVDKCNAENLSVRWSQADRPIAAGRADGGRWPRLRRKRRRVLHVLDATTGKLIWSKPLGGRLATPVVEDGRLYVLTGTDGSFGNLYALAAGDGRELWRQVNANGHQSPVVGYGSS